MKACFKCNEVKPLSEYYVHKRMSDGHLGKCKDCTKRDVAKRVTEKTKDHEWVTKALERSRIKARRYRADGKRPNHEALKRGGAKWSNNNRIKRIAHLAVKRAIARGVMQRKPCEVCASTPAEAHHGDYSKPLDVQWLCIKHHNELHVELRRIARFAKAPVI